MKTYDVNVHMEFVYSTSVIAKSEEEALERAKDQAADAPYSKLEFYNTIDACVTDSCEIADRSGDDMSDPQSEIEDLNYWLLNEDASVYEECKNIVELSAVYNFIRQEIGVEFYQDVIDMIEEEKYEDVVNRLSETEQLVKVFNGRMGRELLHV